METKMINYTRRYVTGQYEYEEVTVSAAINADETINGCLQRLRFAVDLEMSKGVHQAAAEASFEAAPVEEAPMATKPPVIEEKPKRKRGPNKPKTTTAATETAEEDHSEESEEMEEVESPYKKFVTEETEEEETPAPVVEDKKTVKFDNQIPEHRTRMAGYLTQNFPNWKKKEGIKDISNSLVGKAFEDDKGVMLESFKSELKKHFG